MDFLSRLLSRIRSEGPERPFDLPTAGEILRQLDEARDPRVIPQLARHLFSRTSPVGLAATNRIASLLARAVPEDLPQLEESIRVKWRSAYWEPPFVDPLLRTSADVHLLGLLSFHPSGFVRERAVERLASMGDGSELPYLLLRVTDWVAQVAAAARRAVIERIRPDSVTALARNFSLFDRLARVERADHRSLFARLVPVLGTGAGEGAILDVLQSGSRGTKRAIVSFALAHLPTVSPAVVRAGTAVGDPVIRSRVTRAIAQVLPDSEAVLILQHLTGDASPTIRREALTALAQLHLREATAYAERGLLDPSAGVRDVSRFLLRRPGRDFVSLYREALLNPATTTRALASALAGLGEVGKESDADDAAPYLAHPAARARRAALKAVMRVSPDRFADQVLNMIDDPSPAVSAAARDVSRRRAHLVAAPRLMRIFATAAAHHARRNVIPLLAALPKWESITALLQVVAGDDDELATLARRFIARWNRHYNRSQTVPSPRQVEEVTAALEAAGASLDRATVADIRFALRAFAYVLPEQRLPPARSDQR